MSYSHLLAQRIQIQLSRLDIKKRLKFNVSEVNEKSGSIFLTEPVIYIYTYKICILLPACFVALIQSWRNISIKKSSRDRSCKIQYHSLSWKLHLLLNLIYFQRLY